MQYEQATGAVTVESLLRRIADGISKGGVEIGGLTIVPLPALEAAVSIEDESSENLASVVVRLTHFRHIGGPGAVERELAHPGD